MFSFFSRRSAEEKVLTQFLSGIETDIHSHLVPGIDDGVPDVETSISFIQQLQDLGIQKIVTTPHIMMDRYPNSRTTIDPPYQEVLASGKVNIPFRFAAEYYLDEEIETLMQQPLLTLGNNLVLVEISFMSAPPQLHRWLFELEAQGYQPVMAHPERYNYFHNNFKGYHQFKDWGCLLQVNLLSLSGYYGRHIQQTAEKLLELNMIDFIGTDLHHEKHMAAIKAITRNRKLMKRLDQYPFRNRELTHAQ
ncbi:MAG TPA: CpsB/CapC family capsule biosynthesis tyrosine phosphatase [Chitinophaga sp.]|uniref:tyrosine-protein phosphatase n=1 Tax=Chitinophaga sp. TaxID=1869181 RepID=UPI002D1437F8|nr:CpsB/CapC family capsule biosynthesis tyrosine phosphatase [Chitinophaga sp.]HVI48429.1 CpsB/CapC family capsule biosynthesis tyrosine phosphatase [Chitinophaga sp.]